MYNNRKLPGQKMDGILGSIPDPSYHSTSSYKSVPQTFSGELGRSLRNIGKPLAYELGGDGTSWATKTKDFLNEAKSGLEAWSERNPNWKDDAKRFVNAMYQAQEQGKDGLVEGTAALAGADDARRDERIVKLQKEKIIQTLLTTPEQELQAKIELEINEYALRNNISFEEARKELAEQAEAMREANLREKIANAGSKEAYADLMDSKTKLNKVEYAKLIQAIRDGDLDSLTPEQRSKWNTIYRAGLGKGKLDSEAKRDAWLFLERTHELDLEKAESDIKNQNLSESMNAYINGQNEGIVPIDMTYFEFLAKEEGAKHIPTTSTTLNDFLHLQKEGKLPENGQTLGEFAKLMNSKNDATQNKVDNFANSFYKSINNDDILTKEQANNYANMFASDASGREVLRNAASKLNDPKNKLSLTQAIDEAIKESEYTPEIKNALSTAVQNDREKVAQREVKTAGGKYGKKEAAKLWGTDMEEFEKGRTTLENAISNYNAVLTVLKKLPDNTFSAQMPIKEAMASLDSLATGERPAWVGIVDNLEKLTIQMTFSYIAQTKGAITEKEMDLFKRAVVSMEGTKQSNEQYVNYLKEKAQQKVNLFTAILEKLEKMPETDREPVSQEDIKQMKEQAKKINSNYTDDVAQKWLDFAPPQANTSQPSNVKVISPEAIQKLNANRDDPETLDYFRETFGVNPEDYIE